MLMLKLIYPVYKQFKFGDRVGVWSKLQLFVIAKIKFDCIFVRKYAKFGISFWPLESILQKFRVNVSTPCCALFISSTF